MNRAVRIQVRDGAGTSTVGSGLVLAPGLVLTAAHVLDRSGSPSSYGAGELLAGLHDGANLDVTGVIPIGDADLDVAALLVPGADGVPGTAVVGAALHPQSDLSDCSLVGYPRAGLDGGRLRPEYVGTSVLPVSGREAGKLALMVDSPSARQDADWGGLSGAGLFTSEGRLLGIVTAVALRFERRLHAVPITRIKAAVAGLDTVPAGLEPLAALSIPPSATDGLLDGSRVSPPLADLRGESLFDILHHRHRVVPFTAEEPRRRVLDDMEREVTDLGPQPDFRVLLLTGPAGSGKSRLAAELCDRIAGAGWRAGFADHGKLRHATPHTAPLLAVVDYPEHSPEAVGEFVKRQWRQSKERGLSAPVRLVLVSRHATDTGWFGRVGRIATNLDQFIGERRYTLDLADFDAARQERHAAAAFAAFCDGDGLTRDQRPDFDPASVHYDRPLLVHAAALLAARGKPMPDAHGDNETRRLLDLLIGAEIDRLLSLRTDNDTKVFDDGDEVREALCVTTLTSPTRDTLPELLKSTVYFADAASARRHRVAVALAAAFPADQRHRVGETPPRKRYGRPRSQPRVAPVEPDLIAAHLLATTPTRSHIVTELALGETLAEHPEYHARLVEALVLAADDYPEITADLADRLAASLSTLVDTGYLGAEPLVGLLRTRLPQLLSAVIRLANDEQDPTAGRALAAALRLPETGADPGIGEAAAEAVARLQLRHPQPTLTGLGTALGDLAVAHWTALGATGTEPHAATLAAAERNHGVWLRSGGDRPAALAATRRSVALYEALVERDPSADHRAGLARSLNNLAVDLEADTEGVGGPTAAIAAAQRVVELREELATADPVTYLPELLKAYNNLGNYLDRYRSGAVLAASRRAVEKLAEFAADDRAARLPDLARAVHNLAVQETAAKAPEALATARRAVELREELTAANRAVHLPDLADSLHNLAVCLGLSGHADEAIATGREAVAILDELAADDHAAHLPALAATLGSLALRWAEHGHTEAALANFERADALRVELLDGLDETERGVAAVAGAQEAVRFHEVLVERDRVAHLPGLIEAVHRLSLRQAEAGGGIGYEAIDTARRAAALHREQALGAPAPKPPDPAEELRSSAFVDEERMGFTESASQLTEIPRALAAADRVEVAVEAAERMVQVYEALCAADRGTHVSDLAKAVMDLGYLQADASRFEAAVRTDRRAVELLEELTEGHRDGNLPLLANATLNLAHGLADTGQGPQALVTARRAVELYDEVQRRDPHRRPHLANAVWSASQIREQLGVELDEALRLCDRSIALFESASRLSATDTDRLRRVRIHRENLLRRLPPESKP